MAVRPQFFVCWRYRWEDPLLGRQQRWARSQRRARRLLQDAIDDITYEWQEREPDFDYHSRFTSDVSAVRFPRTRVGVLRFLNQHLTTW